ncbi:MAG: L-ribulose-5-phosphate 4-epimerase AraD [Melioribacteraceae bacterium]|nr:L-ribulose-5-phosphate 4-epimerase AraD [Melioribacteraceae bacterium]
MLEKLKEEVLQANLELVKQQLVILTWGNVSAIDRDNNLVVIKPSGVPYDKLSIDDLVVIDLNGNIVEGKNKPSTDSPTHLEIYKHSQNICGITHTHSKYATMFAQACKEINCFGTTHADYFYDSIPVTRFLTKEEVESDYEKNTGKIIVEILDATNHKLPAVLVAGHAPFTFGKDAKESVQNSLILERIAEMALGTMQLNPLISKIPDYITEKHFQRKHGPNSYYGQVEKK